MGCATTPALEDDARHPRSPPGPDPGPARDLSDADQAALVPRPPRCLPAGPVDEVPVVWGDTVQPPAREGRPHLPHVRSPLPAVGDGTPRTAARSGGVPGAGRRPSVGRPARLRGPEAVSGTGRDGPGAD